MFSPPFLRCFVFSAGEDKTVALECKNALAAAHSDIAHETAFFSCTEQGSPQELLCSTYVSDTAVQAPPK